MTSENQVPRTHTLQMTDRQRLTLTGVEEVDCFNEQTVVLRTAMGTLSIAGQDLNIDRLNLEEGRVELQGEVDALEYTGGRKGGGLLGRLFR